MSFNAVTWNILADAYIKPSRYEHVEPQALDPARRRALLLDTIAAQAADLYMLQEVEPDALAAILERLGPGYTGHLERRAGRPDGCALIARAATATIEAVEGVTHTRGRAHTLIARLRVEGYALHVASTHLTWAAPGTTDADHAGLAQLHELLAHRATLPPETPWIIAGDLNTISTSPVIRAAQEAGLKLACRRQRPWDTCNINRKRRKLDYMLYTPGALHPEPGALPQLERDTPMPSATYASDHLPVEVTWRWQTT